MNKMDLVDKFQSSYHIKHKIPINEQKRKIWDINETSGMIKLAGKSGNVFIVKNTKNKNKVIDILDKIHQYIQIIKQELADCWANGTLDFSCLNGSILLITTPCTIQEMTRNNKFDGLNKPKNIVKLKNFDGLGFREDSELRAGRRHIMLTICENGKLRPWKKIKKLLLHELAHTMCNHVTYREEGNHLEDFHMYETFLKNFTSNNPNIANYERINFLGF